MDVISGDELDLIDVDVRHGALGPVTAQLVLTAFALGLRHGIDWDHIAAIGDLTSSARSRRTGFVLSLLYALGHAAVVLVLGAAAVAFGTAIPAGVDAWMGRLVGASLVLLGVWVLLDLRRKDADFRLRSRWMLVLDGTFAGIRRVRRWRGTRRISVVHEHPHDHEHDQPLAHDHSHHSAVEPPVAAMHSSQSAASPRVSAPSRLHSHDHRHDLLLPGTPSARYGSGTATGVGVLHGVGVESPTQIAIFVASTSVAGHRAGMVLLLAWVVGLVAANAGLAALAAFGPLRAENLRLYRAVAMVVAVGSLMLGLAYLGGFDAFPSITP